MVAHEEIWTNHKKCVNKWNLQTNDFKYDFMRNALYKNIVQTVRYTYLFKIL